MDVSLQSWQKASENTQDRIEIVDLYQKRLESANERTEVIHRLEQ